MQRYAWPETCAEFSISCERRLILTHEPHHLRGPDCPPWLTARWGHFAFQRCPSQASVCRLDDRGCAAGAAGQLKSKKIMSISIRSSGDGTLTLDDIEREVIVATHRQHIAAHRQR
jgi:hypothetical protein